MRDLFMILTVAAIYTLALGSAIVTRTYWHLGRWLAWPHRFLLARWLLWSALFGSLVGLEFARHAYWGFRGSLEGGGQASWRASLWILPLALAAFLEARRASRAVLKVAWDKSCDCLRKIFPTAEVASLAEDLRELGFPGAGVARQGTVPWTGGVWAGLREMQPLVPLLNGGEPEGAVLVWGILNYNVARLKGDPASRRWKGFLDAVRTTDTARMGRLYQLRALTAWRAPEEQLVYDGFVEALQWLERAPSFRRET